MPGSPALRRSPLTIAVAAVVALLLWWFAADESPAPEVSDRGAVSSVGPVAEDGIGTVRLTDLPPEAVRVVEQIEAGGPFAHPGKDGSTFGNFEGRLPKAPRGHYREYTVPTPGLDHRGARRIVTGDPGEMYWTRDHYETFARIER